MAAQPNQLSPSPMMPSSMWMRTQIRVARDRRIKIVSILVIFLVRIEPKDFELPTPVWVWITQALDVDAAREASLDRGLDELGSKKREREHQIDLPFGAAFTLCQLRGVGD